MSNKYAVESQQRILRVMSLLFNDVINGIMPVQISRELSISQANVTRDLANLKQAGWVEKIEKTGGWRVSPYIGQQAIKIFNTLQRYEEIVKEARSQYTRDPD